MVLVPAARRHDGDGVARQEKGTARRDLDRPLPNAEIHLDGVGVEARVAPGGVVIDRVDGPELGDGALDEGGDRVLAADVAEHADGAAPGALHPFGHRSRAVRRHVADHHRGAGGGEPQGGGPTDVRGTAADQDDLALELSPR